MAVKKILGTSGNDSLTYDLLVTAYVDDKSGNDTINVSDNNPIGANAQNTTLDGGAGDDKVYNSIDTYYEEYGSYVHGGYSNIFLFGGDGNDYIDNAGSQVTIDGGAGNDTIDGSADSINGGDGNDHIDVWDSYYSTIAGGKGNDVISIWSEYSVKNYIEYAYGDGKDTIFEYTLDENTEKIADFNPSQTFFKITGVTEFTTVKSGDDLLIKFDSANSLLLQVIEDSEVDELNIIIMNKDIYNDNANEILSGSEGNDSILNYWNGDYVTVNAGGGDDSIRNFGNNTFINAGAGNDSIINGEYKVTVDGGLGDDTIYGGNPYVSINGGDGNDYIKCNNGYAFEGDTIVGGKGNDRIEIIGQGYTIQYENGDGNDSINGLGTYDTLSIYGNYSTVASGNDMIVQVGDGSILLVGCVNKSVNINGAITTPTETPVTPPAEANILQIENSQFTYSGGNKNIITYTSEKINFHADFTGLGFNDTDFMLNSSSGSLAIKNARDKILDVAVNNNTVAYAYYASGGGNLDGGSFSVLEVIIGGNNSANTITAGSGGSSLWGGTGGNDIFTGGAGQDNFFFGKNDGTDIINNAGSSDIVNLYDVSLADIISANISGSQISVTFNTGNSLQINSNENLSATFNLANGSFKFNHSSNSWQSA